MALDLRVTNNELYEMLISRLQDKNPGVVSSINIMLDEVDKYRE